MRRRSLAAIAASALMFGWATPMLAGHPEAPRTDCEALHQAIHHRAANEVSAWLNRGVNVDCRDEMGWTPLISAAFDINTEILGILLRSGADVNAKDEYGFTALMIASDKLNVDAVRMLLRNGAQVHARDNNGFTALHSALDPWFAEDLANQQPVIRLLREAGGVE